ncbi:MAG: hypothetical protein ONB48_21585 [candidate division KSB1 bacterium]|nr:hypothetical protein [candidate division KSB1 bacterium]MDZ7276586.1 hypothetical protein [candidate division KSB1 bacterium]MDZ7288241.1 hypothetical protein [candidate division KSB1 bacterium]MDZ7300368.1 hypothetical protein [candidate division KSB1 bacterium]MDZ7309241.1 hypothetical protein [candidate division KSB1 bacterium]
MNGINFTFSRTAAWAFPSLLLGLLACDAPRQNPFDPRAENYRAQARSTITVRRLYPPNQGLSEVVVREDRLQLLGITDANGMVKWSHPYRDTLLITASRSGYFATTVRCRAAGVDNAWEVYLNAEPQVTAARIYSIRDNSGDLTYVGMEAGIHDADGRADIQTVTLRLQSGTFSAALQLDDPLTETYSTRFNIGKLPGNISNEELPTLDFALVVKNLNQDSLVFAPYSVRRVITQTLRPLLPNLDRPESGSILFTWERLTLPYEHFYRIVLFRLEASPLRIADFGPLPATQESFLLEDPDILSALAPGWYLWILQVEDRLGNRGESNAVSFQYFK